MDYTAIETLRERHPAWRLLRVGHASAATARELLSDFREVGEKFRELDRQAREKIASWDGAKGDLLADLVESRADIGSSDQGTSFRAFYDFLLSQDRQEELSDLLRRTKQIDAVSVDGRLATVHHHWAEAAERSQRTVRQISEQLRRFLDDQVWIENRRVVDLVRAIEGLALEVKDDAPNLDLELEHARPCRGREPRSVGPLGAELRRQSRLVDKLRTLIPEGSAATLSDIVVHPIEQGAVEIVGHLSIDEDDLHLDMDEAVETVIDYVDPDGSPRRVRMPKVRVSRT